MDHIEGSARALRQPQDYQAEIEAMFEEMDGNEVAREETRRAIARNLAESDRIAAQIDARSKAVEQNLRELIGTGLAHA